MPDPSVNAPSVTCGYCGRPADDHGDSDAGPMTICPSVNAPCTARLRAFLARFRRPQPRPLYVQPTHVRLIREEA